MRTRKVGKQQIRKTVWGDTPVKDAEQNLRVFLTNKDIADGVTRDPEHCAFAVACERLFGARKVMFLRAVAYVELPQADGSHAVERFILGARERSQIESFDKDGLADPAGYLLNAPSPKNRLDHIAKLQRERKARYKATGQTPVHNRGPETPTDALTQQGVRWGAGFTQSRFRHPDAG